MCRREEGGEGGTGERGLSKTSGALHVLRYSGVSGIEYHNHAFDSSIQWISIDMGATIFQHTLEVLWAPFPSYFDYLCIISEAILRKADMRSECYFGYEKTS